MGLILALERIIKVYYHNGSAMQLPCAHRRQPPSRKKEEMREGGREGEERDAQINRQRKKQ